MILVLSSGYDEAARALVQRWSTHGAALLTPEALCTEGWRYDDARPEDSVLVVEGHPVRAEHLRGVLVRLSIVPGEELLLLRPEERAYAAAEMNAFLVAWLSCLPCPVLNRPTPVCLAGPGWRPEQWLHTAARQGIPTLTSRRTTHHAGSYAPPPTPTGPMTNVIVVGERCLGAASPLQARHARSLARAAGVELLSVRFTGPLEAPVLAGASLWPELQTPFLAESLLERFLDGPGTHQEASR